MTNVEALKQCIENSGMTAIPITTQQLAYLEKKNA